MGSCVRGGGATSEARGRQPGRFPQQRRLVTRAGGREVLCGPAHSGSFGEVGPRRGERSRGDTPPTPRAASGSARELFIHKKDKTPRGASESEPQPPTRTPPRISPGHVPRLRRTGTELRGWQRVRSPRAGPASSGAGRPAAGEAGRTPERDLGLDGIRGAGVSLVCLGFRTAIPSRSAFDGRDRGSCMFCSVQEPVFPLARGTGAAGGAMICESPSCPPASP